MPVFDQAFAWNKPVPKAWSTDLARLNIGERVSSLEIVWQAGWPWRPVQRFEVYELLPAATIESILKQEEIMAVRDSLTRGVWDALNGPDPRTIGQWVRDTTVPLAMGGKRWKSASLVSRTQWLLHRKHGGFPTRCWIIEGEHGGHAWQFGQFEQAFLLASGAEMTDVQALVAQWPNPGDLPFAEYDQRVFDALAERDQLTNWKNSIRWDERSNRWMAGKVLDAESNTRHRAMMERMYKWIEHQVGGVVSDIPRSRLPQWSEMPAPEVPDPDQAIHKLLEG